MIWFFVGLLFLGMLLKLLSRPITIGVGFYDVTEVHDFSGRSYVYKINKERFLQHISKHKEDLEKLRELQ